MDLLCVVTSLKNVLGSQAFSPFPQVDGEKK